MPSTPTSTQTRRPVIAAPVTSKGPMSQSIERATLAEDAVEIVPPVSRKSIGLPSFAITSTPPAATAGDPEVPVDVDLEPIRDVALGQRVDDALLAVGRAADDAERIGLDPHDRPVGLGDDAVRVDVFEFLHDMRRAVLLDDDEAAGMRLVRRVPVTGIGEPQPSVGGEGKVVRSVELLAVGAR